MSATNVARAGKRGNICVGNNVSSFARAFIVISRCRFGEDDKEMYQDSKRTCTAIVPLI